jgi:hypothetical protein
VGEWASDEHGRTTNVRSCAGRARGMRRRYCAKSRFLLFGSEKTKTKGCCFFLTDGRKRNDAFGRLGRSTVVHRTHSGAPDGTHSKDRKSRRAKAAPNRSFEKEEKLPISRHVFVRGEVAFCATAEMALAVGVGVLDDGMRIACVF